MRLGKRTTIFRGDSKIRKQHDSFTFLSVAPTHTSPILVSGQLYNNKQQIEERHRHRYEVNPDYVAQLESHGMLLVCVFFLIFAFWFWRAIVPSAADCLFHILLIKF